MLKKIICITIFITGVEPFKNSVISETVLQRLLRQDVVHNYRMDDPHHTDPYLYYRGKHCDYFIMILQGYVEVDVGKEHMIFEGGPFMYFGTQALIGRK